jgi:hypothetical protein
VTPSARLHSTPCAPLFLLGASLAPAGAPAPGVDAAVYHPRVLVGTWEVVEAVRDGDDETRRFKGDLWTFAGDEKKTPNGHWRMAAGMTRLNRFAENGNVLPGF